MNVELAKLVLKQITTHPDTFRMNEWIAETPCGTTACIAGHVLLLSGYTYNRHLLPDQCAYDTFASPDGQPVHPEGAAFRLLELTDEEYGYTGCEHGFESCGCGPLFFLTEAQAIARLEKLIEFHDQPDL
jgi:hypothetical protein